MTTHRQKVYQDLIDQKLDFARRRLSNTDWEDDQCYFFGVQSLFYALQGKYTLAKSAIEKINIDNCDSLSKARLYEAKLIINGHDNDLNKKDILLLSKSILELDKDSVFAKLALAQVYFFEKKLEEGKTLFLEILTTFPNAKWVYKHFVRMLIITKQYSEAMKYISEITPKFSQMIYKLLCRIIYPHYPLIAIIYTILSLIILSLPYPIFFYSLLAILNLILMLYAQRERDTLILRTFLMFLVAQPFYLLAYFVTKILTK